MTDTTVEFQGVKLIFDAEGLALFKSHKWCLKNGYLWRQKAVTGGHKFVNLHRELLNPPTGMEVDHANGNRLDNRLSNLRICTPAENRRNRGKQKPATNLYKSVFESHGGLFVARFTSPPYLGLFSDPVAAAVVYDVAAISVYGEFASPNFPIKESALKRKDYFLAAIGICSSKNISIPKEILDLAGGAPIPAPPARKQWTRWSEKPNYSEIATKRRASYQTTEAQKESARRNGRCNKSKKIAA